MPAYVAFLRAINLGATRKFGKADLLAATRAAGGTAVQTYLTSGNVLLTSPHDSADAVAADLSAAYAADRGFEVPTIVVELSTLPELLATADELTQLHGEPKRVALTLYAQPPDPAAASAAEALGDLDPTGDRLFVRGRTAYVFLRRDFHTSQLLRNPAYAALGQGTTRTLDVVRRLAARWT